MSRKAAYRLLRFAAKLGAAIVAIALLSAATYDRSALGAIAGYCSRLGARSTSVGEP